MVDTGVLPTHTQFSIAGGGSRVISGANTIDNSSSSLDNNGHGTHVAGTIGGNTRGVAKAVTMVPIKCLDSSGSGSVASVAAGISWAVNDPRVPNKRKVINISIGMDGVDEDFDAAVAAAYDAGVAIVVAAANYGAIACNHSPAREPKAITVGATDRTDTIAYYSNYGSCVDIYAPGSSIASAWHTSNTATQTLDGKQICYG